MKGNDRQRCGWPGDDPLMLRYHDQEWGVPVHDDRKWFEFILLDAFQAGLSWKTVLHKREAFHQVFYGFDPQRVAKMPEKDIAEALANPAIIRNRLKIRAAVNNAQAFLRLQATHGSFDEYIWAFTEGRVIHNRWRTLEAIPAKTGLSDTVSKALKKKDFLLWAAPSATHFYRQGAWSTTTWSTVSGIAN